MIVLILHRNINSNTPTWTPLTTITIVTSLLTYFSFAPKESPLVSFGTRKQVIPSFPSVFVLHIIKYKFDIPAPDINDLLPFNTYLKRKWKRKKDHYTTIRTWWKWEIDWSMISFDKYRMIWCDMVWYSVIGLWYGMIQYNII